jgi:uncharacterized glyoxalase superfamily protein PhnB
MSARLFRVIVPVTDIDRAAAFYGALLAEPGRRVSSGRHYFDCGGTLLACYDARADGDAPSEPARSNTGHLYFAVSDLEDAFDRAFEAGCRQLDAAIESRPWGERSFYLVDPFGNQLCFIDERTLFTG